MTARNSSATGEGDRRGNGGQRGAPKSPPPPGRRRGRFTSYLVGTLLLSCFVLLVLWNFIFVTILPGHVGVRYSWLLGGTRVGTYVSEGLAMKMPWDRIYIYETRVRRRDETVIALSAEGMQVKVYLSTLYRVMPLHAAELLQKIGLDYEERVIRPIAVGAVREAVARYMSNELYTIDYELLTRDLRDLVTRTEYAELIEFNKLVIREIVLPDVVVKAIEEKLAQEQAAAAYTFRLERERQEANRRQIEAVGIRNFYSVVSSALNANLLTWRGIEATVELAKSPNSKIVIVGSGKDQLPLILGSDVANVPSPQAIAPVSPGSLTSENWSSLPNLFPSQSTTGGVGAPGTDIKTAPGSTRATPQPDGPPPSAQGASGEPDPADSQADRPNVSGDTDDTPDTQGDASSLSPDAPETTNSIGAQPRKGAANPDGATREGPEAGLNASVGNQGLTQSVPGEPWSIWNLLPGGAQRSPATGGPQNAPQAATR
ncbi:prohibitin family protein [Breoghania sp. L-A4]|uniref:prohibitin family protein n=1 Tax=Breoghania sp. L-A4 TaxID=2304600 RepID=UPI000E35C50F|nr:prohibitin family protein [Breoghania sp. L-A4]AXS40785.1 prohibitin family protein [Breoghania sp. L-A4]